MHGGDIYSNKIKLDFSVSINPLGASGNVRRAVAEALKADSSIIEQYPDQKCRKLAAALSDKLKLPESQILFGNGASELIPALFRTLKVRRGLLLAPCFSGYERAFKSLRECGISIEYGFFTLSRRSKFQLDEKQLEELDNCLELKCPDIFVVTNPNNPDGSVKPLPQMEVLTKLCRKHGTKLLIDECFMALSDGYDTCSFVPRLADYPEVMVLDAFTKSYALPGLRLGYLLCSDESVIEKTRLQLAEWSVSSVAQAAGVAALQDGGYLERSRKLIQEERRFLCAGLKKLGFEVFSSSSCFVLFYSQKEKQLREKLINCGILIRDCSDFPGLGTGFYRIGIKSHAENQALIEAVKEVRASS